MSLLPKLLQSSFFVTLPSNGKKIEFRPFIEREREILLMALEAKNAKEVLDCIRKLIIACCLDPNISVDDFPIFDIEYCFLQLRAKSIGEIITPNFQCELLHEGIPCKNKITLNVDLTKLGISNFESGKKTIKLSPQTIIELKYPTFGTLQELSEIDEDSRKYIHQLIARCIVALYDGDDTYTASEYSLEDWEEFVQSMSLPQIQKIEEFIKNMPFVSHHIDHICNKCGGHHVFDIEGYESFFA